MTRWGSAFSFKIVDPPNHPLMFFTCVEIETTAKGLQCSGRAASSLALEARARQGFFSSLKSLANKHLEKNVKTILGCNIFS